MSVEQRTPTGSAEPKRLPLRPRLAWIIAAAEALVIVGLVAAIYGLRSNDNPPPTVANANQALLERGGPVKRSCCNGPVQLLPGRVSTDALGMKASFQVFDHWFGEQGPGWLNLGKHLSTGHYEVDTERGGIEVNALDSTLTRTARRLETLPGIRIYDVSPIRLGRHSGRRYSLHLSHILTLRPEAVLSPADRYVTLLGVGHRTLVIEKMANWPMDANDDQEAERVIQSFRFPS